MPTLAAAASMLAVIWRCCSRPAAVASSKNGVMLCPLESTQGESLQIELAVHDTMIAEPPEPRPVRPPEEGGEETEDGEPLSRAEEIRRRIQERREQLRREAEQEEEEQAAEKATQRNEYQEAIRAMMNRNRNNDNDAKEQEG